LANFFTIFITLYDYIVKFLSKLPTKNISISPLATNISLQPTCSTSVSRPMSLSQGLEAKQMTELEFISWSKVGDASHTVSAVITQERLSGLKNALRLFPVMINSILLKTRTYLF
jgi:hypothetical protein